MIDFIFRDDAGKRFRVRQNEAEECWLCYEHPDRKWVTLRELRDNELLPMFTRSLPLSEQEALAYGVPFFDS